jgi:hypothetical protein
LKKTPAVEVGERDHQRRFEASRGDSFRGEVQGDVAVLLVRSDGEGGAPTGGTMWLLWGNSGGFREKGREGGWQRFEGGEETELGFLRRR